MIVLGARPARVQQSVTLEGLLPRPRSVEQRAVVELAARLKAGLDDTEEMHGDPDYAGAQAARDRAGREASRVGRSSGDR